MITNLTAVDRSYVSGGEQNIAEAFTESAADSNETLANTTDEGIIAQNYLLKILNKRMSSRLIRDATSSIVNIVMVSAAAFGLIYKYRGQMRTMELKYQAMHQ